MIETSKFVLHVKYKASGFRYSDWCQKFKSQQLKENPWFSIAEEFPVLIRWLSIIDSNCKAAINELIVRYTNDRNHINSFFQFPSNTKISSIQLGLSDPHRNGRSVIILQLSDGSQLVYKPKPLDIDASLSELLFSETLNTGVRPIKVLAKDGYGWVEHVTYIKNKISSIQKATMIGRASAFFWLINATDFHSENVFTNKSGVFAIDLETVFLAPIKKSNSYSKDVWRNHSIYTTMLFDFSFGEMRKQNISGFDSSENLTTLSPKVAFTIIDDDVVAQAIKPPNETPAYDDQSNEKRDYINHILKGFNDFCQLENKKKLENFVDSLSDNIETRIVFRDTCFYDRILDKMRQPQFLRDGALLYLDLFKLHIGLANASEENEIFHHLIEDEIKQLLQGDIPYFYYNIGGYDLYTSSQKFSDFFIVTGKQHSIFKIKGVEASDINEQLALIQAALGSYRPKLQNANTDEHKNITQSLINLSHIIIYSSFNPLKSPARWISMFGDVAGQESRIFVGDKGFFSGSLGILLSLQAAENALTSQKLTDPTISHFLNEQSLLLNKHLSQNSLELRSKGKKMLGFSGLGGEILAYSTLMNLHSERWSFLKKSLLDSLFDIEDSILSDVWFDVIGGSAGFILGCNQYIGGNTDDEISQRIISIQNYCAKHLLKSAKYFDTGIAWIIPNEPLPLVGFAHGSAGIISALSCVLKTKKSDASLFESINEALHEATLFLNQLLTKNGAWFDYRGGEATSLNRSWCNGMPGVLRGLLEVDDWWTKLIRTEAVVLFEQIRNSIGSTDVHRFCCGEMGNIDFLLDVARLMNFSEKERLISFCLFQAEQILYLATQGNSTFVPERVFPGLFHGLSGILYTVSRFFLPKLPSLTGQKLTVLPEKFYESLMEKK